MTAEHLQWQNRRLRLGDEIRISVAESDTAGRPSRRERGDPALVEKAEKKYIETAAKRWDGRLLNQETNKPINQGLEPAEDALIIY